MESLIALLGWCVNTAIIAVAVGWAKRKVEAAASLAKDHATEVHALELRTKNEQLAYWVEANRQQRIELAKGDAEDDEEFIRQRPERGSA